MTALLLAALMVLSMAACASKPAETAESDLAYIQDKGTLVVGITDFAPMDYQNESGEWIGFDADLASRWNSSRSSGTTRFWSSTARPSTASGTA